MRGHVTALLVQFAKYKHWGNLRRLCVTLPKYYVTSILRSLKHGFSPRYRSVFTEILGCVSGIKFYINNKKKPAWSESEFSDHMKKLTPLTPQLVGKGEKSKPLSL
jgi:hypothetical protein